MWICVPSFLPATWCRSLAPPGGRPSRRWYHSSRPWRGPSPAAAWPARRTGRGPTIKDVAHYRVEHRGSPKYDIITDRLREWDSDKGVLKSKEFAWRNLWNIPCETRTPGSRSRGSSSCRRASCIWSPPSGQLQSGKLGLARVDSIGFIFRVTNMAVDLLGWLGWLRLMYLVT